MCVMDQTLPLLPLFGSKPSPVPQPYAREQALLVACARTRMDARAVARATDLLGDEIDWDYLIDTAAVHGVIPLVQRNLLSLGSNRVPASVQKRLAKLIETRSFHHLVLTHELLAVLKLLEGAGITAIPIKGPVLALAAYGSLTLRDFSDLDLLMERRDARRALAVLQEAGYVPDASPAGWRGVTMFATEHHYGCTHRERGVRVELHWAISPLAFRYAVSWSQLQHGLTRLVCGGREVPQLRPEETLLLLCVHGSKHRWLSLKWICDLAELLGRNPLFDWGEALELARRRGVLRMLLLGLHTADRVLGVALPEEIRQAIEDDVVVSELTGEVLGLLFSVTVDEESELHRWRFHLRMRERLRERVVYTAACILLYNDATNISPRDQAFLPLRCLQTSRPLQYLVRPVRVATDYFRWRWHLKGRQSVRAGMGDPSSYAGCPWDLVESNVQKAA